MDWFKLHHEIADDIKIRRFSPQEKWAWIVLLCLASKSSERGIIFADDDDIADYCEFNTKQDWLYYRDKLIAKGMLEQSVSGNILILNWEKRQSRKPSDDPQRVKERVAKSRANKKTQPTGEFQDNVTRYEALQSPCIANVTPQIRLEENRSEEIRSENIDPDRATQKKADRPKLDQPKAEEQICIFPEKQEINFLVINENAIEDRSSAAPLAEPKKTRKANECDFEVFREVWNSDRPSNWSECKKLDQDRIRMLKRFTDEHGDRSMEIFQNALLYAQADKWCRDPKVKLSINNFMSNGKPLSYSEKLESQQNPSDVSANQTQSQQKMARDYARIARVLGIEEEGVEEYAEF